MSRPAVIKRRDSTARVSPGPTDGKLVLDVFEAIEGLHVCECECVCVRSDSENKRAQFSSVFVSV